MGKPSHSSGLHAFVSRGPKAGTLLYPHRHHDGSYVVSMTRFERDYIRVKEPSDLLDWLEKGYRLRMSNTEAGVPAPSLVEPGSIFRAVRT